VTPDASLICQGLNYASHAQEAHHADRKSNLLFSKAGSSITGPYDNVVRPREAELLDYEVEFALVMRRQLGQDAHIDETNIGEYVAGVVLCNDVSLMARLRRAFARSVALRLPCGARDDRARAEWRKRRLRRGDRALVQHVATELESGMTSLQPLEAALPRSA
jgi:fumarylacetoacetase-like protein